jgi:hypothetical protein
VYNPRLFSDLQQVPMEAERLNALANTLAGLATRTAELRRYL